MKPKSTLRSFLLIASSTLLAVSYAHSATLTWDANGATPGLTDGAAVSGNWDTGTNWWNGSTNVAWASGENAIFGNGGAGGAVGLTASTAVGSLTFKYYTGTYTLGTAAQEITLNSGITKNAGAGIVTFQGASPIKLGAAQTFTNNSATNLVPGAVNLDGNALTVSGTGVTTFEGSASNVISGAGGIIKSGTGTLILDAGAPNALHTFTGGIVVNGGAVRFQTAANVSGRGNVTLNGGYLGGRFGSSPTFAGGLGTGATAIQILGGTSGFSGEGGTGSTFIIGSAGVVLKWGASTENGATGFFNPTVLILGGDQGMNANAKGTLNNAIDLNGTTRTITSLHANGDGAANTGFTVLGAISNSAGTAAGLTKTGPGNIILTTANSYNGDTSINGGSITLSGSGTINSTTALNLGGGTLRLVNTANTQRFADVAVTVSAGGGITYENTNTAAITYTETLGALSVSGGLLNVVQNTNQSTSNGQTLTFGTSGSTNLTQSGTGAVAFSASTTGPQAAGNKNMFLVFGAGTTTAGQIVGPWATVGTAANAQTDYAAYNADHVVPAAIAASAETTWTVAADPYTMDFSSAGTTLTATRNVGALRITGGTPLTSVDITTETITLTGHTFADGNTVVFGTGAPGGLTAGTTYFVVSAAVDTFKVSATNGGAAINLTSAGTSPTVVPSTAPTLALSTGNNLGTNGILNGSPYAISITPGTGGSVTLPTTSAGQLYVNTGSNAITISAPITDNTGALTLVKNGSAGTLILTAANNAYTGDTIINAGTLQVGASQISTQLNGGNYAGNIAIARGAALSFQGNASNTLTGIISGDGNLNLNRGNTTLSGANTYTGKTSMILVATNAAGSTLNVSSFNSVVGGTASSSLGAPTTVANGTIDFGGGGIQQSVQINFTGSSETTDRIINFQFNGNGANRTIDASGSVNSLLKFTSAPISNGSTSNNIVLQGSTNGEFSQGLPFGFTNLTKNGAGTWTLGGSVGNTGTTTISGGTLALGASNILSNTSAVSIGNATLNAATFTDTLGTLDPTTAGATINLGSGAALAFADSSAVNWTGGTLNITGTFVSGSSLRFGTSSAGLTPTQLGQISGVGTVTLNASGFLITAGGNTYADWIGTFPGAAGAPGFNQDADNDGILNGVENFFGTNPSISSGGLVATGVSGNTFTFTHPQNANVASDVSAAYVWSTDLTTFNASGATDGAGTTVTLTAQTNNPTTGTTTVTATVTGTPAPRLFVRVNAIKN